MISNELRVSLRAACYLQGPGINPEGMHDISNNPAESIKWAVWV